MVSELDTFYKGSQVECCNTKTLMLYTVFGGGVLTLMAWVL